MKHKYPSYWISKPCSCGSPVLRLIYWLPSQNKYVVRIVQPACTHVKDLSAFRTISQEDVDEYLKRYKLGEPSQ